MTKVRCYVDGLNFYYGVSRPYNFKWIDLEGLLLALIKQIVPDAKIEKILIFTASVNGPAQNRQKAYLKALQAYRSSVEVVYGKFRKREKNGILTAGKDAGEIVEVSVYEEKGTDVNLACRIVDDAHTVAHEEGEDKAFDVACLVSNDSDLAYALEVKKRLGQEVILITPRPVMEDLADDSDDKYHSHISGSLQGPVPKKRRIKTISEEMVLKYHLPNNVGKYRPPRARGWSIGAAQKARAARLKARKQR